jgi:hypothetical protein
VSWQQAAGQRTVSAPLSQLPPGVQFEDDFPEPIHYDAARKRLEYRGFMPHPSFVALQRLSNDYEFLRCLERLFAESAQPETPRAPFPAWLMLAPAGAVVAGAIAWLMWR